MDIIFLVEGIGLCILLSWVCRERLHFKDRAQKEGPNNK